MLRLSALISFEKLAGGAKEALPDQSRRWGHLHNFAMLLVGAKGTGARYYTYFQMGCRIQQAAGKDLHPIFIHPVFRENEVLDSVWFWLDLQYWGARFKGAGHDAVWPKFHGLLEGGLKEIIADFDGKCGCGLGKR